MSLVKQNSTSALPFSYIRLKPGLMILPLVMLMLAYCQSEVTQGSAQKSDTTARLAIMTAFSPEMDQLISQTQVSGQYEINGHIFTTGTLAGHPVVLFLSGTSMVNAAMNTQAVLDHFEVSGIVFSGIAGGVNPSLHIGDVVVPAEWAEYQEQVFARQKGTEWDTGSHSSAYGHFGMMFPQPVTVTRTGGALNASVDKFWFDVDSKMLDTAKQAAAGLVLDDCPLVGTCLADKPQVKVGGRGVSGPTFVDNAEYRQWVWENFQVDALDMRSAAVAHVAYVNKIPFLAFRSLSDLAGGGPGSNELLTFFQLASTNSARAVLAFLQKYP